MTDTQIAAYPADHPRAHLSIIAELRPDESGTLRTTYSRHTVAELAVQNGPVRVMTWEEWRSEAIAAQAAEITCWQPCPVADAQYGLEVLPPIAWSGGSFCVGEPTDDDFATGRPRYTAYRIVSDSRAYISSRPVTTRELAANRATPPGQAWAKEQ